MANGNFGGGTGILGDPYLVEDAQDLDAVRNNLTAHYKQTADIDIFATYPNWVPIGPWFSGIYDGANYEIQNLTISSVTVDAGLFGGAQGLKNIRLVDIYITAVAAGKDLGGLAGYVSGADNCHVSGTISFDISHSSYNLIGGFAGLADGHISYCSSTVTINITGAGGYGFAGFICFLERDSIVYRCSYVGNVNAVKFSAGFIYNARENCAIEECFAKAYVKSNDTAVGFCSDIQMNAGDPAVYIKNCYFIGTVEVPTVSHARAGFILHSNATIDNCYAAVTVIPPIDGLYTLSQGAFAVYHNADSYVNNCYQDADISGDTRENVVGEWWDSTRYTTQQWFCALREGSDSDAYQIQRNLPDTGDWVTSGNNTPYKPVTGIPTAKDWVALTRYAVNRYVQGTDGICYRCKLTLPSDATTDNYPYRPISGASWATYWEPVTSWEYFWRRVKGHNGWPQTTLEMKYKFSYNNWDFETIWGIKILNDGYPYFQWQTHDILNSYNQGYPYLKWELSEGPSVEEIVWGQLTPTPIINTQTGVKTTSIIFAKVDGQWRPLSKNYIYSEDLSQPSPQIQTNFLLYEFTKASF